MKIQYDFSQQETSRPEKAVRQSRQASVKRAFIQYWKSYVQNLLMKDGAVTSDLNFAQASMLVGSLETLWIMGMKTEFYKAITIITAHAFTPTDNQIVEFEPLVRYLGGLLAAYDLTDCQESSLLHRAMEVGDILYLAFETPSHMPMARWSLQKASQNQPQDLEYYSNTTSTVSFSLEFTRLSQLTGDMRFHSAALHFTTTLLHGQSTSPFPGLALFLQPPSTSSSTLLFSPYSPIHATLPSTQHLLSPPPSYPSPSPYESPFTTSTPPVLKNLLFRPITPHNTSLLLPSSASLSPTTGRISRTHTSHPPYCSVAGTLALASRIFTNPALLDYARRIAKGCIWTSLHAPPPDVGVMPQTFSMLACSGAGEEGRGVDCRFDGRVWRAQVWPGFETVGDERRRVEWDVVRGVWVVWRVGGGEEWVEGAWGVWKGVEGLLGMERDEVDRVVEGGEVVKVLLTLKYFYLMFSETGVMSLDEWIVGEGGHMFRIPS